jgi:release factor glutamine methyltransferase
MITVKDVFTRFKENLSGTYESNEIESLTLLTLSEITGSSKAAIKAFTDRELLADQAKKTDDILSELKTGKPLQYILGHTEFYGLPFKVTPAVLIPRPETEELVEWVLSSIKSNQLAAGSLLDIGTGSGCIPISLKKHLQGFDVASIDISSEALAIAKQNAELNNVDVNFIEGDVLNLKSEVEHSTFDIIISNPPYVTLQDKQLMHANVTDFEPHTALFVPENDPLIFYRAIADFALKRLNKNGLLFFEINESYGNETVELLNHKSFRNIELRKDMSGRDRMIKASLQP